MDSLKLLKRFVILLTGIVLLALLLLIFQFTDVAFRVWDRLQQAPTGFFVVYFIGIALISGLGLILIYKIWLLGYSLKSPAHVEKSKSPRTLESVQKKLSQANRQGVEISEIARTLDSVENQIEPSHVEIAFFGKISTGKSSLIQTILPRATLDISIIGGATISVDRYSYQMANGLTLTLLDMPGTHRAQTIEHFDEKIMAEARQAHVICYVLDQDITASDQQSIALLKHFAKPMLIVLNKINRYNNDERQALIARIQSRIPEDVPLILTASAYWQPVRRLDSNGHIQMEERFVHGEVYSLLDSFAELAMRSGELNLARRQALIDLADDSLDQCMMNFRREKASALVKAYSRKAMLGGMAAVGPGTDLLVQGYLGVDMLKSLCKLYGVSVQEIDLQKLLESASSKVKTRMTVILALAGNVCKAFPGVGTILGGAAHAIAYGLIFESLGNATCYALHHTSNEDFNSQTVLKYFEEQLNHDLEKRATSLVETVINRRKIWTDDKNKS